MEGNHESLPHLASHDCLGTACPLGDMSDFFASMGGRGPAAKRAKTFSKDHSIWRVGPTRSPLNLEDSTRLWLKLTGNAS